MKKLVLFLTVILFAYSAQGQSHPHELSYAKNASGIHVIYTQGTILIENTDDAFVLGNLAMTYTDENSSDIPILSLLFEEMDLRGRVGKIFQMKSPKLTIQLSNGEVFTCPSGSTSIKAGYALLGESVSVNFGACNLMSTKSPSNRIDRTKYVLRQLSTYNIVAVTIDDCSFKVKGESDKLLNSAPTFAEMCKQMKFKITYKQCFEF